MVNVDTVKLRAEGLTHVFKARSKADLTAVKDVGLTIHDGEFVSIVGPSGCGKSTLLNILVGLLTPTKGRVFLNGKDNTSKTGRIGYMPQRDLLMPWRSIQDNVILGMEIDGMPRGDAREAASEMFRIFGLEGFEKSYPDELSGGMRQRASMMRTFLADKEVNLLDEPFGRLDSLTRTTLQEWLMGYCEANQKTMFLITHDIDEAILLSDRIYVMSSRPGTIIQEKIVHLDRPRDYGEVICAPEFIELKHELLGYLHPKHSNREVSCSN